VNPSSPGGAKIEIVVVDGLPVSVGLLTTVGEPPFTVTLMLCVETEIVWRRRFAAAAAACAIEGQWTTNVARVCEEAIAGAVLVTIGTRCGIGLDGVPPPAHAESALIVRNAVMRMCAERIS